MSPISHIRQRLRQILHLDESPNRTAAAFALGVFIAFSPTYGLHTLSVLACAWLFRLNVVAVMAGSLINNPWTLVPFLAATFWAGFTVMGQPAPPAMQWEGLTPETLYQQIAPYFLPFFVGGVTLGLIGALIAYPLARIVITRARERRAALRAHCEPGGRELR
jgi:uncharacterized protein (DUF2062 family)